MTPDFDYIEELQKASTPAPWRADCSQMDDIVLWDVNAELIMNVGESIIPVGAICKDEAANAKLIVAIRNNLTELLRLARLGAAVEQLPIDHALYRQDADQWEIRECVIRRGQSDDWELKVRADNPLLALQMQT